MPRNSATGCFELTIQKKQKAEKGEKNHATAQQAFLKTYNIPLKNWDATQQRNRLFRTYYLKKNKKTEKNWDATQQRNRLFRIHYFKEQKTEKSEKNHATAQQAFSRTYSIQLKN